jgi:hypothetical protein
MTGIAPACKSQSHKLDIDPDPDQWYNSEQELIFRIIIALVAAMGLLGRAM